MKKYEVSFRPLAEADLSGIYRHIVQEGGHEIAGGYIDRIEAACMGLEILPKRGTARDDMRPGLRTMGFERRATIVFQVKRSEVVIARLFYGGQDFESALRLMTRE